MANTLRIKRRAAGGAAGPPATLAAAELAYNEQDDKLYYGKGNSGGIATSIVTVGGPGALGGGSVTISGTPPGSPTTGSMWWDTTSGQLFIWYDDGTSSQWVVANNPTGTLTPTQTRALLQTIDPVGQAYVPVGPFTNAFDTYEIEWMLSPTTLGQTCAAVSLDGGATWVSTAGGYHYAGNYAASNNSGGATGASTSYFPLSMNQDPGSFASGLTKVYKPWLNGDYHKFNTQSGSWSAGILYSWVGTAALMANNVPVTHMRFFNYSGVNWGPGGYIKLYGIR